MSSSLESAIDIKNNKKRHLSNQRSAVIYSTLAPSSGTGSWRCSWWDGQSSADKFNCFLSELSIIFFKEVSLPLSWGLCFLLPDVHISAWGPSPPAAELLCLLKSGRQHRDASSQIWRARVKDSTEQVCGLCTEFCTSFFDRWGHKQDSHALFTTSHAIQKLDVYERILQSIVGPFRFFIQSH